MGMVRRWVDTGMQESPQQMAELLELVITAFSKLSVPGEGR